MCPIEFYRIFSFLPYWHHFSVSLLYKRLAVWKNIYFCILYSLLYATCVAENLPWTKQITKCHWNGQIPWRRPPNHRLRTTTKCWLKNCRKVLPFLFYSRTSTAVLRKGGKQRNVADSSCHQRVSAPVLNPVPQMHYFVKKDFSSLLESQSKIKLKSNLVGVSLVIRNKQSGIASSITCVCSCTVLIKKGKRSICKQLLPLCSLKAFPLDEFELSYKILLV